MTLGIGFAMSSSIAVQDVMGAQQGLFTSVAWQSFPAVFPVLLAGKVTMELQQSNSLRSYKAVAAVLEEYEATWSTHVGFAKAVTAFNGVVTEITEQAQIQLECERASEEKLSVLKALGIAAYEVSAAIHAYAVEVADLALEARVDFSRTAIVFGKEDEVISRCWAIHALATQQLANLAENGITATKLNAFKKKIEAFETVQPKPRNRVNKGSAATRALESLFREASTVLRKRLDKLVTQFTDVAPEFVKEYEAARVVVDVRPAKAKVAPEPTPAPTPQPA